MAEHGIYQVFKKSHCERLIVTSDMFSLAKSVSPKIRECMKGKRKRFPFSFAGSYSGDGKRKVGLSVFLERTKKGQFRIVMGWFFTDVEPPDEFGKVSDLFHCLASGFGQRQVDVAATFAYPTGQVESIFRPIQLAASLTLFDEIVGFSGIKRDNEGKFLYGMTVSHGEKELAHFVQFKQAIELTEDLPLFLIPRAQDISNLALEKKVKA